MLPCKPKTYEVSHDGFHWRVSQRNTHFSMPFTIKESAISAARRMALANQPSQVIIHTVCGQIEAQWSHPPVPITP